MRPATLRQRLRYRWTLLTAERRNYSFTQFLRTPAQLDALTGPVLRDHLHFDTNPRPLRVASIGCSIGAEPYAFASVLLRAPLARGFTVRGFDIEEASLARARTATYSRAEVESGGGVGAEFRTRTFLEEGDAFRVRPEIREHVSFAAADALSPELPRVVGEHDVVLAQNFLYHLPPRKAEVAFRNICKCLAPSAALFVDGADVDLRTRLTREAGLEPLDDRIEEIHEEARRERGTRWPYIYWSLEPLDKTYADWRRRYATIFLKRS